MVVLNPPNKNGNTNEKPSKGEDKTKGKFLFYFQSTF